MLLHTTSEDPRFFLWFISENNDGSCERIWQESHNFWLSSSPNFHIHPLQNKFSIVFALSKFVRHEMVSRSIPISSCFFLRFPKCVKSVILWTWIWLKDCQGEQSSLTFMKKTSQTDEESFSNYRSGNKYLEKEIVPLHS